MSTVTAIAVRTRLAPMPGGVSHAKLAGVSLSAGIGFTVALFIATLAYPGHPELLEEAKVGILGGSLLAGVAGAVWLPYALAPTFELSAGVATKRVYFQLRNAAGAVSATTSDTINLTQ